MDSQQGFFTHLENRRKTIHFFIGIIFIILLDFIYFIPLVLSLIVLLIIASIIIKYYKDERILKILASIERKEQIKRFPLKGAIYYLIGILVTVMFFDKPISSASIMILAVGDPVACLIGQYYGKKKIIINPNKLIEGTLAGTLVATLCASIFIPLPIAFFGAISGMMAEAIELEIFHLDDNIFIPIVAGFVMESIMVML